MNNNSAFLITIKGRKKTHKAAWSYERYMTEKKVLLAHGIMLNHCQKLSEMLRLVRITENRFHFFLIRFSLSLNFIFLDEVRVPLEARKEFSRFAAEAFPISLPHFLTMKSVYH